MRVIQRIKAVDFCCGCTLAVLMELEINKSNLF